MKKNALLLILLLLLPIHLISQNLVPSVLSVQGGFDQSERIMIEWTLGEIFIETAKPDDLILTQGFHQPVLKIVRSENSLHDLSIYPNPVNAILNIQMLNDFSNQYNIKLFDSNGASVKHLNTSVNESGAQLDMTSLMPGVYLLNVLNPSGTIYKTYRVIKY